MSAVSDVFSMRLKALREAAGMTQTELGKTLGSGKIQVSRYETGKILPNAETLVRIAGTFDCSADFLLGRSHSVKGEAGSEFDFTPEERGIIQALRENRMARVLHLIALVLETEDRHLIKVRARAGARSIPPSYEAEKNTLLNATCDEPAYEASEPSLREFTCDKPVTDGTISTPD